MSDLISRKAAIEAVNTALFPKINTAKDAEKALNSLPSAQPKIIRCGECKYRGETEDGEYNPEDIVCAYWMSDGLRETDYCSYAERREEGGGASE